MSGSVELLARELDGKLVAITGAARGLGLGIATVLAERGARLILVDHDPELLSVSEGITGAIPVVVDVRDCTALREAFEEVADNAQTPILGLVNNAGVLTEGDALSTSLDEWTRHMDTNVTGAWFGIAAVLPGMIAAGGGSIVNVGSIESVTVGKRHLAYAASKGALVQLSRSVALDFGPQNVRCNTVSPGAFLTDMLVQHSLTMSGDTTNVLNELAQLAALRRHGEPSELGEVVSFLLSDRSSFMTGADITIDGGRTLRT